jgi:anti-sigma B factor antagonist
MRPVDQPRFHLRALPDEDVLLVSATGELDLAAAQNFETEIRRELAKDGVNVVLDLSAVQFIDSTGIRALLRVADDGNRDGSRLTVRRDLQPAVKRLLKLTECMRRLPFAV